MAQGDHFPHLKLSLRGTFRAKFPSGVRKNAEVEQNKQGRIAHASKLRSSLQRIGNLFRVEIERRQREGLPAVDAGAGFVMRIPDGADPDAFAHSLGVQLVAETEGGFMLVATEDLSFQKLEEVLAAFEAEEDGGGAAASLLEIFEPRDDPHRIEKILTPDVLQKWPFDDDQEYVLDISIQTAEGTRSFKLKRLERTKRRMKVKRVISSVRTQRDKRLLQKLMTDGQMKLKSVSLNWQNS